MIWFTADEHYYHHNMLLFRNNGVRPFRTTDEMNRTIIKNHNEVVNNKDTVYHLGDFAYGPGAKSWTQIAEIIHRLKGNHHLILGNHDHIKPFDYVEAGFISVHTYLEIDRGDSLFEPTYNLIHDPAVAGVLKDKFWVHGHTHGLGLQLNDNTYCVSVEMHDYFPVPITQISFKGV